MSTESFSYRVRGTHGPLYETVKTFNPDPQFFKQAVEWCMVCIGPHGGGWCVEEYLSFSTIVLNNKEDLTCFKLAFPNAYITDDLTFKYTSSYNQ